ncbi:hypothetical protein M0534_02645 [Methylonatrum kenyense]|uniref:hypothetical protein n=1 Tax=Methylonatrum kenyense TaxID=455253 RepID=UPI0020C0ADD6|nr:hypothetical protein [Methylonatrum kenyense]MCK8515233.1 hypothetical protein [Methylonatrum kenyense]
MAPEAELQGAESLDAIAASFMPAGRWQERDAMGLQNRLRQTLAEDQDDSVLHPDARFGPLSKALRILLNEEPELPRARFHLRYARATVQPDEGPPLEIGLVEVSRFNLGPTVRESLARDLGEERVAPPSHFGEGPDVSWRFLTRPVMGQAADITAAGRRELTASERKYCLGSDCGRAESINDVIRDWPRAARSGADPDFALPEAALLDVALAELGLMGGGGDDQQPRWKEPEWPETAAAGEPFLDIVVERGLGQDDGLDLVIRQEPVMDHEVRARWKRLSLVPTAPGEMPKVFSSSDQATWPDSD